MSKIFVYEKTKPTQMARRNLNNLVVIGFRELVFVFSKPRRLISGTISNHSDDALLSRPSSAKINQIELRTARTICIRNRNVSEQREISFSRNTRFEY